MSSRFAEGTGRYAPHVGLLGVVCVLFSPLSGVLALVAGATVLGFHRDPEREVPDSGIVSPADGRVSVIREEAGRLRLGVFMNVTDVHVNRAPMAGTVESVTHTAGKHWPAFSKESDRNEKVHVEFDEYTVVLIAGAVARRIHPTVTPGQRLERGDRIGHISFSSRVDVIFPPEIDREDLLVERGTVVRAGETRLVDDSADDR